MRESLDGCDRKHVMMVMLQRDDTSIIAHELMCGYGGLSDRGRWREGTKDSCVRIVVEITSLWMNNRLKVQLCAHSS